ncbi:MAG: cation:proton antiporter [Deltaproteobacteria bacterium]|nr:cation:proton antiporter [Deltaproteobacteria bacterium]
MALELHNPVLIFTLQVLLIMGVSRGIGLLLRGIGQPMVVAEVVAGILLGPSLFGWMAPGAFGVVFNEQSLPVLNTVSQFGLILFMFLVGLEMDFSLLKGRGRSTLLISTASITVPFILGAGVAWRLYGDWAAPGVALVPFILFLGTGMSVTAFPVLARILAEQRLLHTPVGGTAIAVAALNDITAWCVLAFVVAITKAQSLGTSAATLGLAAAYTGIMWWGVRPFLARLSALSQTREGVTQGKVALVVGMVLLSAMATELIGIHALFGAFLFGALWPKTEGFVQQFAHKMEDLVLVVLLPLFFAYSGLRTQINLLDNPESWGVGGLLIAVAFAGKFIGGALPARFVGIGWRDSAALGVLVNTRGLMELVVLNIGLELGVITPVLFTMMVLMALVSTFMTSPLLRWLYPRGSMVRKQLDDSGETDGPAKGRYTVMMCVSYAASGPGLLRMSSALAGEEPGGRLVGLSLTPPPVRESDFMRPGETSGFPSDGALGGVMELAAREGIAVRPFSMVSSNPSQDIGDIAAMKSADLIVLGWHKPLVGQALLGGVVFEVMQRAPVDVAVFFDRGLGDVRRVLVPFQGSPHDRAALTLARRLVQGGGARATILHIVAPGEESPRKRQVSQNMREVFNTPGEPVELKVIPHGDPVEAVLTEINEGYDLVVVGIGKKWGLHQRPVGFQPDRLISGSPVSLLVVRQSGQPIGEPEV